MNAIAKTTRKREPGAEPAVMPEQVRAKLMEAKARAAALTARQLELAERSVQSPEVEKAYFETVNQLSASHGEIERLELAIQSLNTKAQQHAQGRAGGGNLCFGRPRRGPR
jgi:hypothetical protein